VLQKFKILKHDPDSAPQERDLGSGKATDILAIRPAPRPRLGDKAPYTSFSSAALTGA